MNIRTRGRGLLAAAMAGIFGAAVAQVPVTDRTAVERALQATGYGEIRDVNDGADDGLWGAEVRAADGAWHGVHVVAATGEVLDRHTPGAPLMDESAVAAALAEAGYRNVRDLELAGAIWKAEAETSQGRTVELRVNARNGSIDQQALDVDLDEPEERDD
jgi:phosphoribosylformylglycinamidine (FGAM) synthase PurS component